MDQHFWFKRKNYGYGWTPVNWKGWLFVAVLLTVVILGSLWFAALVGTSQHSAWFVVLYSVGVLAVVLLSIGVARKKGPKPRWQWGGREHPHHTTHGGTDGAERNR